MAADSAEKLLQAVVDEDEAAVAAQLRGGADPNPAAEFGDLPLVNAATQDSTLGIVRLLVEAGAKVDVLNEETGSTPLVLAVAHGAREVACYLVDRGAALDVAGDVSDCLGRQSPLILAVDANDLELVRFLLAHGADPNRFGDFHGRPLHYAARDTHVGVLTLLLDHGADVWFRDGDCNQTALELALRREEFEAGAALYRHIDAAHPNGLGAPIHALAANGDVAGVAAQLDADVSVDLRDGAGKTPLHWAVGEPRPIANLILAAAETSVSASVGARARSREEVIALLLRRGADVDALDASNDTPLHDALAWGGTWQLASAEALVRAGANVRLKDDTGWTPLLLAARSRAPGPLLALLFARGANPSDTQGSWNALTYAAHTGAVGTAKALLAHGVPVNIEGVSPLHTAVARGHVEIVRALLAAGADPTARDGEGNPPAGKTTSSEILELLGVLIENPQ